MSVGLILWRDIFGRLSLGFSRYSVDSARHYRSYSLTFSADGWCPHELTTAYKQNFDRVNMNDTPFHNNFSQPQQPESWDEDSQ